MSPTSTSRPGVTDLASSASANASGAATRVGLRIHGFAPSSRANGPGRRAVVWVQGCSLGCPGCYNPMTHPFAGPLVGIDELFERIVACPGIEGLTVSGGEPLQQRRGLVALLERIRAETTLSTTVFTGFSWDEVTAMPHADRLLATIDVLVAGRYAADQPLGIGLRGSANQTVHLLTGRYSPADVDDVPCAELIIDAAGDVVVSGIDPPSM